MASLEEAIFAELAADPTIAGKIADGSNLAMYYDDVPNGKEGLLPSFIVISKISESEETFIDFQVSSMQITAISSKKSGAISLKDDIIRVLTRFQGNLGGKREVRGVRKTNSSSLKTADSRNYMEVLEFNMKHFGDNV